MYVNLRNHLIMRRPKRTCWDAVLLVLIRKLLPLGQVCRDHACRHASLGSEAEQLLGRQRPALELWRQLQWVWYLGLHANIMSWPTFEVVQGTLRKPAPAKGVPFSCRTASVWVHDAQSDKRHSLCVQELHGLDAKALGEKHVAHYVCSHSSKHCCAGQR